MAPKAARASAASSGVDHPAFNFVFSVLKNCESIKPDWGAVAAENGIAYGKNASARFKSIVENHGLKFADEKIFNPTGVAPAPPKTPSSRGKKRKADEVEVKEELDNGETPTKKLGTAKSGKKTQPATIKNEEASDDDTIEVKVEDESPTKKPTIAKKGGKKLNQAFVTEVLSGDEDDA